MARTAPTEFCRSARLWMSAEPRSDSSAGRGWVLIQRCSNCRQYSFDRRPYKIERLPAQEHELGCKHQQGTCEHHADQEDQDREHRFELRSPSSARARSSRQTPPPTRSQKETPPGQGSNGPASETRGRLRDRGWRPTAGAPAVKSETGRLPKWRSATASAKARNARAVDSPTRTTPTPAKIACSIHPAFPERGWSSTADQSSHQVHGAKASQFPRQRCLAGV